MLTRQLLIRLSLCCILALLICSCSVTRHVPEGSYLLKKNVVDTDKEIPSDKRISSSELETYIRQSPNKRILGINIPVFIHSLSNPNKDNWFNRMLRKVGEAPVLMDTLDITRSVANLKTYMNTRGFLASEATYRIDTSKKKATVHYLAMQNKPYKIGSISYDFRDKFIQEVLSEDSVSTLLHSGDIFDTQTLDKERQRITTYLKNNGYYDFSISNISYLADSMIGNQTIDLTMIVRQNLVGYASDGSPEYENNAISRINKITLLPGYNATRVLSDSNYLASLDTLNYQGVDLVYDQRLKVKPSKLRNLINLYPNSLYTIENVNKTYNNIIRNDYFNSANILFQRDSLLSSSTISYVGSGTQQGERAENTKENYLNCTILAMPALRQSYKIELEASTTSNYYALTASVGYQNRNLFRGMEVFDISLLGGYEFMRDDGVNPSFEIGGSTSISFPGFILPFDLSTTKFNNQRTKFELSVNKQQRPYYHRTLSSATWGYSWNNNRFSSFTLRPIDVSLVKMSYIDQDFLDDLTNPYLQNSYISQLIAGISGSYVYNNQSGSTNGNSFTFRLNLETTGNLISGLTHLFSNPVEGEDYYNLLSIRYAQYARAEFWLTKKITLAPKVDLVYRFLAGAGVTYGNSESMPFDRLFFCGGSNGMRGWAARTLGPGNEAYVESDYPTQLGSMKLETNLEARFPVWGILQGAVFFDLGNIWFMKEEDSSAEGTFYFDKFYKQLGFNTGLGARLDFGFFLVRLDWGVILHDPNRSQGDRWIKDLELRNTSFNFGVGYPF